MEYSELVTICTLPDPISAEIIKNALNAEGIRCYLEGINQAGEAGILGLGVKVQVLAGDADRAEKLVASHEGPRKASSTSFENARSMPTPRPAREHTP
jgi:hypothetical protein